MTQPADPVSAAIRVTAERWWDLCSAGPGGHIGALLALRDAVDTELNARGHTPRRGAETSVSGMNGCAH